jgi:hypothetical protein
VPTRIIGPPCHWGYKYRDLVLQFDFAKKIQCFGGRRNIYAEGNASTSAKRFSVLSPTMYRMYINDATPKTLGAHLALFADDTQIARRILFSENCSAV